MAMLFVFKYMYVHAHELFSMHMHPTGHNVTLIKTGNRGVPFYLHSEV